MMFRSSSRFITALLCALLLTVTHAYAAPDGKALFSSKCASCHNPYKDATGPALNGVDGRVPSKEWLVEWIHNPSGKIDGGDPYAGALFKKWGPTKMTAFPELTAEDIDAIVTYVNMPPPVKKVDPGKPGTTEDNTSLYTLLTLGLLLVAIILWRVNSGLKAAAARVEGQPAVKEIPLYRNKAFIAIGVLLVLGLGGYFITNGAVEMGRQQNYMPKQPIFYSHKVHAGINQINCLYCHAGAEKSKHAMVPSTNVCMNCHKQISSYTGAETDPLKDHENKDVNGSAEIQKLYVAAGWNPEKKDYNRDAAGNIIAPGVEWIKIHNLPDHVYFNHSQHVKVGGVQCQQCHGAIETMDEVYQSAPLSMGWCINCHRQTEVKFKDNNYYSIFEKYHKEMAEGKRNGVTVEDIGGIECQKCHY